MQKLLSELLAKAENDREVLRELKQVALDAQQYELGARLREIEREKFPDTEDQRRAKEKAEHFQKALLLCDIEVKNLKTAWIIYVTAKELYWHEWFSIETGEKIKQKAKELFGGN